MVGVEVVVEADVAVGPDEGAVAVWPLLMEAVVQALADDAPLHRDVGDASPGDREGLVDGPARRAMVDDHVTAAGVNRDGIELAFHGVAWAHPDVADNHIVGDDLQAVVLEADSTSRRRLSGDRDKGLREHDGALQLDGAGHIENDDPRSLGLAGLSQAPRDDLLSASLVVLQGPDNKDLAAAPSP